MKSRLALAMRGVLKHELRRTEKRLLGFTLTHAVSFLAFPLIPFIPIKTFKAIEV
jgi:hypothetical protein